MNALNIVIVTQNAPVYLASFLDDLLGLLKSKGHRINGLFILTPYASKSFLAELKRRFDYYGLRDFIIMSLYIAAAKIAALKERLMPDSRGRHSVRAAAAKHGVPVVKIDSVNTDNFVKYISGYETDVLVSIAAPEIFGRAALNALRKAALNYHTGALPAYRGRQPLFRALLNNENKVSVTVHEMNDKLDAGPVVASAEITVEPSDTLHTLYLKTTAVGPKILAEAVEKINSGDKSRGANNPAPENKPFGFPDKNDVKIFRSRGKRFF